MSAANAIVIAVCFGYLIVRLGAIKLPIIEKKLCAPLGCGMGCVLMRNAPRSIYLIDRASVSLFILR